ncbi:hypothetical protein MMC29_000958 [Sticta canariensis]|nr:hypothetical protein [Sticta canariensis]
MPSPPESPTPWRAPSPIPARSESPYGGGSPLPKPTFLEQLTLMVRMSHMARDSGRILTSIGTFRNVITGRDEVFPLSFVEKVIGDARPRSQEQAVEYLNIKTTIFAKILDMHKYDFDAPYIQDYLRIAGFTVDLDLVEDVIEYYSRYGGPFG